MSEQSDIGAAGARWVLPLKVAALTVVIGPLAGAVCIAASAVVVEIFELLTGTIALGTKNYLTDWITAVPALILFSYFFGIVPAVAAACLFAGYLYWGGRRLWAAGLTIGTLMPPLCLLLIGANDLPQSADRGWLRDTLLMNAAAAALGFAAALITGFVIYRLLRKYLTAERII